MPLALHEVNALSPAEIRRLLLQLLEQDLHYFDRSYITHVYQNPDYFLNELRHIESVRRVVADHRRSLTMPRPIAPIAENGQLSLGLEDEIEFGSFSQRRREEKWQNSFFSEYYSNYPSDYVLFEESVRFLETMPAQNPKGKTKYTLRQLAEKLPAGTLGLQQDADGKPFNLIFRAERENDPRKKLLKGDGWYEVSKVPEVLWAAPTLEAYNVLEDTGLEFGVTGKVRQWYHDITSMLPIEFRDDSPLFDYQKDAVRFMVKRDRAMLSLSPGLGKTLTSASAASYRHAWLGDAQHVLLVCPASLLHYWKGELNKWSSKLPVQIVTSIWHRDSMESLVIPESGKYQVWVITNPETLVTRQSQFEGRSWNLMILDESIMYKHRESKRSKAINEFANTISKVWLLTGAPATRYLDDLWHQFHILNNRGYSSYWRFANRYCFVEENQWATTVIANRRGAEEQVKANFSDIYFARSQDQVSDIPDWLFEDIDIPMPAKQDAIYERLKKELKIELGSRPNHQTIKVSNRLDLILKSLQVASNPILVGADNSSGKWAVLPELMEVYPGPYIIWVNFIRTGEMLLETLKPVFDGKGQKICLINGSTPMEERNQRVDQFQAGEYGAIIMNSAVGKFGFTLTKARTSFFVERMYDDSYFQCLHRNRRIGTTESPVVVNMRSVTKSGKRTIDHVVHDALDYRTGMIRELTIGEIRELWE